MRIYHLVEAESLWALSQRGAVNLPQVKELQDRLRAAGHDPGPSDGWYGKRTADAVRAYQRANNLTVDGDAGPQTLGSLGMAGANNTPPRETPPEETPPAPAPRQPSAEPPDEPAPTRRDPEPEPEPAPTRSEPVTRSEPESTPTTVPFSNLRSRGRITLPSNPTARSMRDAINQISEIDIRLTNFVPVYGRAPMVDLEVDVSNYNLSYTQRRQVGRNILDFLQEKFVSSNDMELAVRVNDTEGTFLITRTTVFIDANTSASPTDRESDPAPTRSEPEDETSTEPETQEASDQEKIRILSRLSPQATLALFGPIRQGNAQYFIGGVRLDQQNPDAVIILGGRQSSASDAELQRLGIPRQSYSIYAFSLSQDAGYRLQGRNDFDDPSEAYTRYGSIRVGDAETYPLVRGSSQFMRRQQVMSQLERYTPNERDLDRVRNQNESIDRLSKLAGL